jgi:hypothetical protein
MRTLNIGLQHNFSGPTLIGMQVMNSGRLCTVKDTTYKLFALPAMKGMPSWFHPIILFGVAVGALPSSNARHFLGVASCTQRCGNDLVHVWPVEPADEPFPEGEGVCRHTTGTRPIEPVPECRAGSGHCDNGPPPTPNNNSRHTASVGHRWNQLLQGINAALTVAPLDTVPVGHIDHLKDNVQRQLKCTHHHGAAHQAREHWQCSNQMATECTRECYITVFVHRSGVDTAGTTVIRTTHQTL